MSQTTLLDQEDDHPQEIVFEHGERRVVTMDSASYVDARNTGKDVIVAASYIGVLPARMMAMHAPRAVIGHDACDRQGRRRHLGPSRTSRRSGSPPPRPTG